MLLKKKKKRKHIVLPWGYVEIQHYKNTYSIGKNRYILRALLKGKKGSFHVSISAHKGLFFLASVLKAFTATVRASNAQVLFDCGRCPCISIQLWVPKNPCRVDVKKNLLCMFWRSCFGTEVCRYLYIPHCQTAQDALAVLEFRADISCKLLTTWWFVFCARGSPCSPTISLHFKRN